MCQSIRTFATGQFMLVDTTKWPIKTKLDKHKHKHRDSNNQILFGREIRISNFNSKQTNNKLVCDGNCRFGHEFRN